MPQNDVVCSLALFSISFAVARASVHRRCSTNHDCLQTEFCDTHYSSLCHCLHGYTPVSTGECLPAVGYNELCRFSSQCSLWDKDLICERSRCKCHKGLRWVYSHCVSPNDTVRLRDEHAPESRPGLFDFNWHFVAIGVGMFSFVFLFIGFIAGYFQCGLVPRNRHFEEVGILDPEGHDSPLHRRHSGSPPTYNSLSPPTYEEALSMDTTAGPTILSISEEESHQLSTIDQKEEQEEEKMELVSPSAPRMSF